MKYSLLAATAIIAICGSGVVMAQSAATTQLQSVQAVTGAVSAATTGAVSKATGAVATPAPVTAPIAKVPLPVGNPVPIAKVPGEGMGEGHEGFRGLHEGFENGQSFDNGHGQFEGHEDGGIARVPMSTFDLD